MQLTTIQEAQVRKDKAVAFAARAVGIYVILLILVTSILSLTIYDNIQSSNAQLRAQIEALQ